jgi:hypothetical protein
MVILGLVMVKDYVTFDLVCFGRCCGCYTIFRYIKHVFPTYILENVPLLSDIRSHVMASVHEIRSWIGLAILLDTARVDSRVHHP